MARGAAKSAELRRIAARDEPLLFGSLYKLPTTDSTATAAASGTALARARSFMRSIRGWFK